MSTQKVLVLTRPDTSSACVLAKVRSALVEPIKALTAPVMKIVPSTETPDLSRAKGIIVTSSHAVPKHMGNIPAYCVGARTADAVRSTGGLVEHCAPDAARLLSWLLLQDDLGALVYLRGSHVSTDLAAELIKAGRQCSEILVYRQEPHPLTLRAIRILEGEEPAILPLFSARSARLVGQAIAQPGPELHVIAISNAVARAWRDTTNGSSDVCDEPTGGAMISKIVAALQS